MKKKAVYMMLLLLVTVVAGTSAQALRNEVFVEGGLFLMGADNGADDEKPMHEVAVSSFWIMKTEVTQVDWVAIMGSNPSNFKGDNLPVEQISWIEAVEYANALSEKDRLQPAYRMMKGTATCDFTKNGWRLPTEAEWEYAAMGGVKSKGYEYAGSNSADAVGWYNDNSQSTTHPVGMKRANELGIYDMSGNVLEWCWDLYTEDYYKKSPVKDPRGPSASTLRVDRGGSWMDSSIVLRVAFRGANELPHRHGYLGFRLVRPQF